jgi:NTP pyrophosphatase (non-canonical NTP hydrolase)
MCGEAGELANVVKKLRRHESGTASPMDPDEDVLRAQAADEIADVFLYLGLLADAIGVDMPSAIARKFDAVSIRQDFPDRVVARRVPGLVGIVQTARRTLSLSDYHDGGRAALRAVYDLLGSACLPDGPAAYSAPDQEVQP